MLKKYLTKKMGRVMVAAAMAAALVVPAGVQAATYTATTPWISAAEGTSSTKNFYYNGTNLGYMKVTSNGTSAITEFTPYVLGDYTVYASTVKDKKSASTGYTVTAYKKVTHPCSHSIAYGKVDYKIR